MSLYNKLLALSLSILIITLSFFMVSTEKGTSIELEAPLNASCENSKPSGMQFDGRFIDVYGSGGYITIYSEYASSSKPLHYASVFQMIYIERETTPGGKWSTFANYSIDMTSRQFYSTYLNLTPGYFQIKFGTLLDYNNQSQYLNGTLPAQHSAFMILHLPRPTLLFYLILAEIASISVLISLSYLSYRKNRNLF
jgi:hypothetical protein